MKNFTTVKNKCDMNETASRQMAMIYKCAIEAIKMMQNPKIKEFMLSEFNMP